MALEPFERERAAGRRAQAKGAKRGEKSLPVGLPEERGETRERVARFVGLKPSTYERGAKVLREGSPELVARFESKDETVNSASTKLRHERQRAAKAHLQPSYERARHRFRTDAGRSSSSIRPGRTRACPTRR